MQKLCYTTKYCKKQKQKKPTPKFLQMTPTAASVKQLKLKKLEHSLTPLSSKQHCLVPTGQLPSAAESDGGCDLSGAQCWGLAESRRRWKGLLLKDNKREEIAQLLCGTPCCCWRGQKPKARLKMLFDFFAGLILSPVTYTSPCCLGLPVQCLGACNCLLP